MMGTIEEAPTFNLKAVVRETGLKPDTLRAWERRYGLPQPRRTTGGHRLYSQRDIDTLKWLIARQEEGLSISRAVELWQRYQAEGRDPLQAMAPSSPPSGLEPAALAGATATAELRDAWVDACLAFDEPGAEHILTQAFALYPPEVVCLELMQKGLAQVGEHWYRGDASVQQEHFSSALAIRRLQTLVAATPAPSRAGRIVSGCPPQEEHTFGPLLVTWLLRRAGWQVTYLGANVPLDRLDAALRKTGAQLVVQAAQRLPTAATLSATAQFLQQQRVTLAYGGLIFNTVPQVRTRIAGHFLGEQLDAAPRVVEQLLAAPYSVPAAEPPSKAYVQALDHLDEQHAFVEADVRRAIDASLISPARLATANDHLLGHIRAALTLGDMDFLRSEVAWVAGLLRHHGIEEGLLKHYLRAYHEASQTHLGAAGRPLLDWLARLNLDGQ